MKTVMATPAQLTLLKTLALHPRENPKLNKMNCTRVDNINPQALVKNGLLRLFLCAALAVALSANALSSTIREFPVNGSPRDIAVGPDGNIWFTEIAGDQIGRITKDGAYTEFPVPTPNSDPHGIAVGPDGNIWFTELGANQIGRITMEGEVSEFPLPTANGGPHGIAEGSDGNLWFTEIGGDKIGRITTKGVFTEFPLPTAGQPGSRGTCGPATSVSQPLDITPGPDRNLWFTECNSGRIGRITTEGEITEFSLPTANSQPHGIVAGPDHNIWFAESATNTIVAINTAGAVVTEVSVPTANSSPQAIAVGPDRKLWFTEFGANQIASISLTPEHAIVEIPLPESTQSAFGNLFGITGDPPFSVRPGPPLGDHGWSHEDPSIWFVELAANKIGQLELR